MAGNITSRLAPVHAVRAGIGPLLAPDQKKITKKHF
jgi:hypothetical protein